MARLFMRAIKAAIFAKVADIGYDTFFQLASKAVRTILTTMFTPLLVLWIITTAIIQT